MFGRKKRGSATPAIVQTVPEAVTSGKDFLGFCEYQSRAERQLYDSLRASVPVIDAAVEKIVRLTGRFRVLTDSAESQRIADDFVKNVKTNGTTQGLEPFVYRYLDNLITYGQAVGEMIPDAGFGGIAALYNASLDDVEIRAGKSPLEPVVSVLGAGGAQPVKNPDLVFLSILNQKEGALRGKSLLSGLPFVSSILTRIFESLKTNWERVGDVRFAVTYTPQSGESLSADSAKLIADEWKKAMRSDRVCDFVSSGNINVKVIGAESGIPDCEVPVRAVMEQILAKLGIPPFLLGISWSSTERMSGQQADILTSELEYYRLAVEPVIRKAAGLHLRLSGYNGGLKVEWEDINLQDSLELSQARLNNARAMQIEAQIGKGETDD